MYEILSLPPNNGKEKHNNYARANSNYGVGGCSLVDIILERVYCHRSTLNLEIKVAVKQLAHAINLFFKWCFPDLCQTNHQIEAQVRKTGYYCFRIIVLRELLKGAKKFSTKRLKQLYSDARGTTRFIYSSIYLLFIVLMFLCIND